MSHDEDERLPVPSAKEALIMQLLVGKPEMYGLQLVEESGGKLKRGTVYVTLDRMEDKTYISSRQEDRGPHTSGIPRRLYKLEGHGLRVLRAWEMYGAALAPEEA